MNGLETRRRTDSFLRRISRWFRNRKPRTPGPGLLSVIEFNQFVLKEQSRCARRPDCCQFSIVRITIADPAPVQAQMQFALALRQSLRLVDEVAFRGGEVALLLPETGRSGAGTVASRIPAEAANFSLKFELEIFTYPDEDALAAASRDVAAQRAKLRESAGQAMRVDPAHPGNPGGPTLEDSDAGFPGSGGSVTAIARLATRTGTVREAGVALTTAQAGSLTAVSPAGLLTLFSSPTPLWKSAMDVICSGLGLLLLGPLFLVVAVCIRLDSRGPVFYRQKREGKDGRVFEMLKFRTMRDGAEELRDSLLSANLQDGPAFKVKDDPRVTRVGRYLRKSCIDELPQLLNVLKRDMSLVGPRPLPVSESRASNLWHRQRLTVLPGLTCLWQVAGDRNMKFDRWMRLDLLYIRKRGFWLDLGLIARTAWLAVMHRGNA